MTSDERQDWIKHLLSEADVAVVQAPPLESGIMESPPKEVSEAEGDFTLMSTGSPSMRKT